MATVSYSIPTSTKKFMYSDGPETLGQYKDDGVDTENYQSSYIPSVLLVYKTNSYSDTTDSDISGEYMPEQLEFGMYHNNNIADTNVTIGIIISNEAETPITVTTKSRSVIAESKDGESTKDKELKSAINEAAYHNWDTENDSENLVTKTTVIGKGSMDFVYYKSFDYQKLISARGCISLVGTDCTKAKLKIIAFATSTYSTFDSLTAPKIWEATASSYPACATGQFSGVVSYSEKTVTAKLESIGDSFEVFNTEQHLIDKAEKAAEKEGETFTVSGNGDDFDELVGALYHKPIGKKLFDGNFAVAYNMKLTHPPKDNLWLKLTPYGDLESNLYGTMTFKEDGSTVWTSTNEENEILCRTKGTAWQENYYIALNSSGVSNIGLILPGGNCGVWTCELVNKDRSWYNSDGTAVEISNNIYKSGSPTASTSSVGNIEAASETIDAISDIADTTGTATASSAYEVTYTSDYKLKAGDVVAFNYCFSVDMPTVSKNPGDWELADTLTFRVNETEINVGYNIICDSNGDITYKMNDKYSSDGTYSGYASFTVDSELAGTKLDVYALLNRLAVYTNKFYYCSAGVEYELYLNGTQIV